MRCSRHLQEASRRHLLAVPATGFTLGDTNVAGCVVRRYWYPLSYFSSLAFQPTALIGLNSELQLPKFSLTCNIKPSVFAYPPPVSQEAEKEVRSWNEMSNTCLEVNIVEQAVSGACLERCGKTGRGCCAAC